MRNFKVPHFAGDRDALGRNSVVSSSSLVWGVSVWREMGFCILTELNLYRGLARLAMGRWGLAIACAKLR